jgi:predicted TIM-barrel fold metal-dependent hydrolase
MAMTHDERRERFLRSGRDADLPIVDAHLHFWDPQRNYHPWLCDDPPIPFRYGDYRPIRRPFLPADYKAQTGPHSVVGTVYMEAEWSPQDPLGEVEWIHGLAADSGWPNAMIAQAWLDRADIDEQLAALAQRPLVSGVRHKPAAVARDAYDASHRIAGSMRCPRWQRGFAELARHGLIFELQTPWWHLQDLLPLLERHPQLPVVINHAGVPGGRDDDCLTGWNQALAQLVPFKQVSLKLSGLGLEGRRWHIDDNRRVIDEALRLFGTERCLFASNFPVDSLVTDLGDLFGAFKQLTGGLSAEQRLRLFCDNAVALYRLNAAQLGLAEDPAGFS